MVDLIGAIIIMLGVIAVYDARSITKKRFSFGEQNQATKFLKWVGFILTVIGSMIIIYS